MSYFTQNLIGGYRSVAIILLFTVSILATLFDILPVLIASISSAFIWNFFFIPPQFTLHISNTEDILMFLMYFFIALVNAVLTFRIRSHEKKIRDKEEKENAIKFYNTLFNTLSHELKTPISAIIGAIDTLKENRKTLSEKSKIELYDTIDTASTRLNRQVGNLLNMSRLESGILKPKLEWEEVNEMIFAVIQKLSEYLAQHEIEVKNEENLPLIKTDMIMFEQILSNILLNAAQYTPFGTKIIIKTVFLQHSQHLQLIVSDNGKGFPKSEIPFIFDKFYRLPNSKAGGTGLGLSIVKGFVQALNGTIKLENVQPQGAKFTIELPCETSYINNLKNE